LQETFAPLFRIAKSESKFTVNKAAVIYENPVYAELNKLQISLHELTADTTDYKAKLKETSDEKEQRHILTMIANKRRSSSASQNLDDVFAALFGG